VSIVDPQQWQRIKALFQQALDQPPERREAFVRSSAESDVVANEVISLLTAHASDTGRHESNALTTLEQLREVVPEQIGPYRPLRVLGRGGMGVVWLAERADGAYQQRVALKRLAAHLTDPVARERFQRERETLARLDHPHIARLLDGGIDSQGLPWFAMTYVEGEPITQWCDAQRLGLNERLRRMQQVLDALDAAHRQLVVHRDLKPSNVLVDHGGRAHLLDFGIAKWLQQEEHTATAARMLTPDYAAPEQVEGHPISTATDVYAAGVLLFELLTGRLPYRHTGALRLSEIVSQPALRLRQALTLRTGKANDGSSERDKIAAARGVSAARLHGLLDNDLQRIVERALQKAPQDRYPSVRAMADDIDAWLTQRPLRSMPTPWPRRLQQFARRQRWAILLASVLLFSAVLGVAAVMWQARETARQAARADATRRALSDLLANADPFRQGTSTVTLKQALDRGLPPLQAQLEAAPEVALGVIAELASVYGNLGEAERGQQLLSDALTRAGAISLPSELRFDAWLRLARLQQNSGHLDTAEQSLKHASTLVKDANDLERLTLISAEVDWAAGRKDEAIAVAQNALDALTRTHTREAQTQRLAWLRLLSNAWFDRGDPLKALQTDTAILELQESIGSPADIGVAAYYLASTLAVMGKPQQAAPLFERAATLLPDALGQYHVYTLSARAGMASALQARGDYSAAASLMNAVLDDFRAAPVPHVPGQLALLVNLARLQSERGRCDEAKAAMTSADSLIASHPQVGARMQGPLQQIALECALQSGDLTAVLDATQASLAADSPSIVDLVLHARALLQQGRIDDALPYAELAATLEAHADRPPRASGRAVHGDVLRLLHRLEESRSVLEAAVSYWQAQREDDGVQMNPRLADVQIALAKTLKAQDEQPRRQGELLQSALRIRQHVMGERHPWTQQVESELRHLP
jgi:serine/threonine protein kinase/tetratricopeptide (TPR) repeat protein